MLEELYIENFILIEKCHLVFDRGLNILTGETGTGKSILVEAVGLLLGDRASVEYIRDKTERSVVEGFFSPPFGEAAERLLENMGFGECKREGFALSREILRSGKNVCRINGRAVNLSTFRELADTMIDIYGQQEHQSLTLPKKQLEVLDVFGGEDLLKEREELEKIYRKIRTAEKEKELLEGSKKENLHQIDLLEYQIKEIEAARLRKGEEEELLAEQRILGSAEKLAAGTVEVYEMVFSGTRGQKPAYDLLAAACNLLAELSRVDSKLSSIKKNMESALYLVEEASRDLKDYIDRVEQNPSRLEEIQQRLDIIYRLKRKYGETIESVLKYKEQAERELFKRQNCEEKINKQELQLKEMMKIYEEKAEILTEKRKQVARYLEGEISRCLQELNMPHARFKIKLIKLDKISGTGRDKPEFLLSPNPGEPLKPLSKIASGGELSRIMLALKSVLAVADQVTTQIFDEVDTGVGGQAARTVAHKLYDVGKHCQVICVTHLPQIASFGDRHFYITKINKDGRTISNVKVLEDSERVKEISRMLDSGETELSYEHAREMLSRAAEIKKVKI